MIDPNKLTEKSQEALVAAQQLARENGHAQVDVEHLAAALVDQSGGIVPSVLSALQSEKQRRLTEDRLKYYDPYPKQLEFHAPRIASVCLWPEISWAKR